MKARARGKLAAAPAPVPGTMNERFDLGRFTDRLIEDLELLRAGKITPTDARARADLARQVLRSIGYVLEAQKVIDGRMLAAGGEAHAGKRVV